MEFNQVSNNLIGSWEQENAGLRIKLSPNNVVEWEMNGQPPLLGKYHLEDEGGMYLLSVPPTLYNAEIIECTPTSMVLKTYSGEGGEARIMSFKRLH